jgi:Tol biopolymer transport system component
VKGWAQLKEAFWAAVEGDAADRTHQIDALAAMDPELANRLEALLAADDRGESFEELFGCPPPQTTHPERIGGYEILGVLGSGGMGQVYQARDVRLGREVAIKIVAPALTDDRERLVRFEHEAKVLASLNHPNIAQVYGLDESGGAPALVMELVRGPSLATVIAGQSGEPLALPRALVIARQIADGLDAAHEKGIVHRDLKPGNIALTDQGEVKILDFGIAKSLDAADRPGPAATHAGVLLGTPAYMSPEQARGLPVDRRTDIWAFGCVLYELLSGQRAFGGDTASDILAAVLDRDPDMATLPAEVPAGIRSLLHHCLEKDRKRRLRDIGDARPAIDDGLNQRRDEPADLETAPVGPRRAGTWMRAGLLAAGVAIGAALVVMVTRLPAGSTANPDEGRRTVTSLVLPPALRLGGSGRDLDAQAAESRFAVSPDGRKLAVIAVDESGRTQIWVRDLGSAAFLAIPQTEDASFPFWSPDSKSIGFVGEARRSLEGGSVKTVRVSDGAAMTVSNGGFRMGAWSRNGLILFAPARSSPLHVVSVGGGPSTPVTRLDKASGEVQHGFPAFLPDGRHFLYFSIGTRTGALEPRGVFIGSLDTAEPPTLLLPDVTQARYASGHVLFVQGGTLLAQPFDTERRQLRGVPFRLVEDVKVSTAGATGPTAAFSVSDNGVLVYQAALRTLSRPVWFDRKGTQLAALAGPADYGDVALGPDGSRLAVSVSDQARSTRDLWIFDKDGGRSQRVTFDPGDEFAPVWSPDGTRLLFSSAAKGQVNLHVTTIQGAGEPSPLDVDVLGLGRYASDWSHDGRYVMYIGGGRAIARSDLWIAPLSTPKTARPLLESAFIETHGRFAPHGPWFAYASNETGQLEVYVDRFPDLGDKRLVSTQGGRWPRWSSDGRELIYVSPENQLMAVDVKAIAGQLAVGPPRPLFTIRPRPAVRLDAYPYDVSRDGQRFIVNTLVEDTASTAIQVVLNWTDSLPKR